MVSRLARSGFVPAVGIAVVLTLSACGSQQAPGTGPGGIPDVASASPTTTAAGSVRPVTSQSVEADGGLSCPESIPDAENLTVPQKPQGVDGNASLLPDRAPLSMVVCRYPILTFRTGDHPTAPYRLEERLLLAPARVSELVEIWTWAPRGDGLEKICTRVAGDETGQLVGVRYSDGIVWVAAKDDPNSCSDSTNGDFRSSYSVGVEFRPGRNSPTVADEPSCFGPGWFGRLGDDISLAPPGEPDVTVCRYAADGTTKRTPLDAAQSAQVVILLRGLDTRRTGNGCSGNDPRGRNGPFTLVLDYAEGPALRVHVTPGCRPPVMGSGLDSDDSDALVALVEQWSPKIPGPDKYANSPTTAASNAPDAPPTTK